MYTAGSLLGIHCGFLHQDLTLSVSSRSFLLLNMPFYWCVSGTECQTPFSLSSLWWWWSLSDGNSQRLHSHHVSALSGLMFQVSPWGDVLHFPLETNRLTLFLDLQNANMQELVIVSSVEFLILIGWCMFFRLLQSLNFTAYQRVRQKQKKLKQRKSDKNEWRTKACFLTSSGALWCY